MATGTNIKTFYQGAWHNEDLPLLKAADHGAWLGTTVFDGARYFDGVTPDLLNHCERVNRSASALMINPTIDPADMVTAIHEGLKSYSADTPVYIRPMYWALTGDETGILPSQEDTGFAICLEQIPMAPPEASTTLTRTSFRRPVLEDNVVNAKAGCLYPNNARMIAEARSKGFKNALVADAMGNVAETASANVFMVKDGEVFTPIPNGTFLAGITRARHIKHMKENGIKVHETVLSFQDFHDADEIFLSGNMMKVTPVTAFDDSQYEIGKITNQVREMYWDWATSAS
jgi:branched-chain amino acid aminotransferase